MGRTYTLSTGFQAVSAAQDLIELKAGTATGFKLHSVAVSCTTDYDDTAGVQLVLKRAAGTYTSGSGGGSLTAAKLGNLSDAADSFAGEERNNTTQAVVGTGSLDTIYEEAMAPAAGFQFTPTPELQPHFAPGEALVLSISAPADEITMSAVAIVEEL